MIIFKTRTYSFIIFFLLTFVTYTNAFSKQTDFGNDWYIASSFEIKLTGEEISSTNSEFNLENWYSTNVPSTVLSTLIKNGEYKNIYFGRNISKVNKERFSHPWWYRKEFKIKNVNGNIYQLIFNGLNYRADIFINGKKIGDSRKIFGTFLRFNFNLSNNIRQGKNIIAVKVYPPEKGVYSVGFVDWNPRPPDNNMGLWRTVKLVETGKVSLSDVFVKPYLNTEKLDGGIHVSGTVKNYSNIKLKGTVSAYVKESGSIVSKSFELLPFQEKRINIAHIYFPKPKLWWPHTLGKPYLYNLELRTVVGQKLSDLDSIRFGIRKVEDYKTREGFRGYKINGKKVLIKGGGWVDDLSLTYDKDNIKTQIQYIKDMNFNTIRLEGLWGNSQYMYDLADENGLLIMIGYTCHWEWADYLGVPVDEDFNGSKDKKVQKILTDYFKDQVIWLRNHPSVFVWAVGSDKIPFPGLEKKYIKILNEHDGTRAYLAATKEFTSKVTGNTGVKMRGPYAWTAPVYWYEDTKNGGAFGFNSETGPGAQIPVIENLKKMIPADNLWPINKEWDFHCARNEFKNISRYVTALNNRYGKSKNLEEFVKKAHIMDYELIRPMFEAFIVNRHKSTGIIQWMINSAWPQMFWQLYDWYLVPTGAYYGAKNGSKPLHIIYRYGFNDIWVANEQFKKQDNIRAEITLFNKKSKITFKKNIDFSIEENKSIPLKINIGKYIKKNILSFISLKLFKGESEIDSNFYWVSNKMDILDYKKTEWFLTPVKSYANFSSINTLPETKIEAVYKIKTKKNEDIVELKINNKADKIAFFINVKILDKNGNYIIPVSLSENFFSILPSGEKTINFRITKNKIYNICIDGWNTDPVNFKNVKF